MATRSFIAIQDGTIFRDIYCHNDGYLGNNGFKLKNFYNTFDRVNKLIELGDISSLGHQLSNDDIVENTDGSVTLAYGRDRNEEGTFARVCNSENKLRTDEYNYLFKDGVWYWRTYKDKKFRVLTDLDIKLDR